MNLEEINKDAKVKEGNETRAEKKNEEKTSEFVKDYLIATGGLKPSEADDLIGSEVELESAKDGNLQFTLDWEWADGGKGGQNDALVTVTEDKANKTHNMTIQCNGIGLQTADLKSAMENLDNLDNLNKANALFNSGKFQNNEDLKDSQKKNLITVGEGSGFTQTLKNAQEAYQAWLKLHKAISEQEEKNKHDNQ